MGVCKTNREACTPHSCSQLSGPLPSASKARSFFRARSRGPPWPLGAIAMAPSDSARRAASDARERRMRTNAGCGRGSGCTWGDGMGTGTWQQSFIRACTLWSLGPPRAEHPFHSLCSALPGSAMHCMVRGWDNLLSHTLLRLRLDKGGMSSAGSFASRNFGRIIRNTKHTRIFLDRRYLSFIC